MVTLSILKQYLPQVQRQRTGQKVDWFGRIQCGYSTSTVILKNNRKTVLSLSQNVDILRVFRMLEWRGCDDVTGHWPLCDNARVYRVHPGHGSFVALARDAKTLTALSESIIYIPASNYSTLSLVYTSLRVRHTDIFTQGHELTRTTQIFILTRIVQVHKIQSRLYVSEDIHTYAYCLGV